MPARGAGPLGSSRRRSQALLRCHWKSPQIAEAHGEGVREDKEAGLREGKEAGLREVELRGRGAGLHEGKEEGLREGEVRVLRAAVLDLCEAFRIELTEAQRAALGAMGVGELEALRQALKQTRRWPG